MSFATWSSFWGHAALGWRSNVTQMQTFCKSTLNNFKLRMSHQTHNCFRWSAAGRTPFQKDHHVGLEVVSCDREWQKTEEVLAHSPFWKILILYIYSSLFSCLIIIPLNNTKNASTVHLNERDAQHHLQLYSHPITSTGMAAEGWGSSRGQNSGPLDCSLATQLKKPNASKSICIYQKFGALL